MERRRTKEVDRLSALPEPILHHIMSFLSFKERVQISILSKKWEWLWDTFPVLEWHGGYNRDNTKVKMVKYLEQTLLKRHVDMISINELSLEGSLLSYPEFGSFLDRCLCYAIGSNVKKLKLRLSGYGNTWYDLPQIIFCAKSIEVLELWDCKLYSSRLSVKLFMKKLLLRRVYVDDHVIKSLIAGCPLIELTIVKCRGFKSLELLNLNKLERIEVEKNDEVERMVIKALNVNLVTSRDIDTSVINLASCKNLKRLELYDISMMDEWLYKEISELQLLEHLSLYNCKNLRRIHISCPSLKELLIQGFYYLDEVKINTPSLSIFRYKGVLISFTSNASMLSEADLCFNNTSDTQEKVKYIELLSNFRQVSGVLNLQSSMGENVIICRELRKILRPPLSGIKHLNLEMEEEYMFYSIPKFVDGLLWLSPHIKDVSVKFRCGFWRKFSFQFLYKRGETHSCCQSRPVSCWQNCIEKVDIIVDTIIFEEELEDVKRYCIEDNDIFEKFKGLYKGLREEWDDDCSINEDLRGISDDNDSYHS